MLSGVRINIYSQEKDSATYRLAKMNLALRGISHNLGATYDSSFTNDQHKGLYFNYIMANLPFNLKGWYDSNLENDSRWADYGMPPESNANYAWILHILSHLKPLDGVAGFLLANGALGDSDTVEIRKKLIQNDKVEAINLSLGDNYKPLDAYFKKENGDVVKRVYSKGEKRNSNQTLPRIACQVFEKPLAALSVDEKENFPVCKYSPGNNVISGIYASVDDFKKHRNTIEYLT